MGIHRALIPTLTWFDSKTVCQFYNGNKGLLKMEDEIYELIGWNFGVSDLDGSTVISSLGDSLDLQTFFEQIEDSYDVDSEELDEVVTIDDLIELCKKSL